MLTDKRKKAQSETFRLLVPAPTTVPAAATGIVGEFAKASVGLTVMAAVVPTPGAAAGGPPVATSAAVREAAPLAAAADVAAGPVVAAPSRGLCCRFVALSWPGTGSAIWECWWERYGFSQHVVHHCRLLVRQDFVGGRGGVDRVLVPQLNDDVNIHIVVFEAEGMGPPHDHGVVDPGIDIPDGLDHLVDVVFTVVVGQVPCVLAAPG